MTAVSHRLNHRTLSVPSVVFVPSAPSRPSLSARKPFDESPLPVYTPGMSQNLNLLLALALLLGVAVGF
jgi:hypothetical protein